MICHQRKIREEMLTKEGCALGDYRVKDCVVERISRKEAADIILRYEWLKSMPQVGRYYYGLIRPDGKIIGAACFGVGPSKKSRDFCGTQNINRVLCLERGACAPIRQVGDHADGAASRLIMRACKAITHETRKDERIGAYFAYSDVEAAEIGTVYQACGWTYIGQGTGRRTKSGKIGTRPLLGRYDYFDPDGERHTSRRMRAMLRRHDYPGNLGHWYREVGAPQGWSRKRQYEKHKYVLILAKDLSLDTQRFPPQETYPSRETCTVGAQLSDWRSRRWPCYGQIKA